MMYDHENYDNSYNDGDENDDNDDDMMIMKTIMANDRREMVHGVSLL